MHVNRRDILSLLGAIAAAPLGTRPATAQQRKPAQISMVTTGTSIPRHYFDEAMRRLGWVDGKNLALTWHVTGTDPQRRARIAAELVAANPDVIVAGGTFDAVPIHALTSKIPIVVISGVELERSGMVQSLARPGGNVTGVSVIGMELDGKRLELLRELFPKITRVAMLGNPNLAINEGRFLAAEELARPLALTIDRYAASAAVELDGSFAAAGAARSEAILVPFNAVTYENRPLVIGLAARNRLPAVYELREYVEDGGLVSYGPIYRDNFEGAAALVDKILKGERPGDLPVARPTRFELVINRHTADALGLAIPSAILSRADEVIE